MKHLTSIALVGKLEELCHITPNKLNHELSKHFKEIDEVKDELIKRLDKKK